MNADKTKDVQVLLDELGLVDGPSVMLDKAIAGLVGGPTYRAYTSSLDSALLLVPGLSSWEIRSNGSACCRDLKYFGATSTIALCRVALAARFGITR